MKKRGNKKESRIVGKFIRKEMGDKGVTLIYLASFAVHQNSSHMKLSQKISDFNTEAVEVVPYLTANATALKIDAGQVADAASFLTNWIAAYLLYSNILTHTPQSVIDINTLYRLFHFFLEGLKHQLKANKSLNLTGADYVGMHMHIDGVHRTHIPRPTIVPANKDIKSTHLVTKIFTSNPEVGHEGETKLPVDVARIGRKICVVAEGVTPVAANYHPLEDIGGTTYDLVFDPAQEGAFCWIITYYLNPTAEKGPESPAFSFRII